MIPAEAAALVALIGLFLIVAGIIIAAATDD